MTLLTVTDVSRVTGRSRPAIYRAIESKRLAVAATYPQIGIDRSIALGWSSALEGPMREAELQAKIITLCAELRLLVFHSTDSRRDLGRGFPDLVICGRTHVLFCETKDDYGQLSSEQTGWRYSLQTAGAQWRLWRPRDWADIEAELRSIA